MGRKNLRSDEPRPLNFYAATGGSRVETKQGVSYTLRRTMEGSSVYKCPGCNREIPSGEASWTVIKNDHILGEQAAIDERRHWHDSCWKAFR
ncbi:MAG: hypothetical protein LBQ41_02910 [Candidatus Ancillula sp.]|jgi:hypothetical protein|nr:hypothetical protein [Candidatus Ancillula sp.]